MGPRDRTPSRNFRLDPAKTLVNSFQMIIRKAAASDALDILSWRNDPLTRAMSRSSDVIEEAAHIAWFTKAMTDSRRTMLIAEVDCAKVGLVRFDHCEVTEVSIIINPEHRCRGLGQALLLEALTANPGELIAEIKPENMASRRIFERAGFEFQEVHNGLRRYVRHRV